MEYNVQEWGDFVQNAVKRAKTSPLDETDFDPSQTNGKTLRIFVTPGNPWFWTDTDVVERKDLEKHKPLCWNTQEDWVVLEDRV